MSSVTLLLCPYTLIQTYVYTWALSPRSPLFIFQTLNLVHWIARRKNTTNYCSLVLHKSIFWICATQWPGWMWSNGICNFYLEGVMYSVNNRVSVGLHFEKQFVNGFSHFVGLVFIALCFLNKAAPHLMLLSLLRKGFKQNGIDYYLDNKEFRRVSPIWNRQRSPTLISTVSK